MTDKEEYNGYKNKSTWAVKLHWDNNEGDYKYFTGEAKRFKGRGKEVYEFADFLKEQAEEIKHNVIYGESTEEAKLFIDDVGDINDVDWQELAEDYYKEVDEE